MLPSQSVSQSASQSTFSAQSQQLILISCCLHINCYLSICYLPMSSSLATSQNITAVAVTPAVQQDETVKICGDPGATEESPLARVHSLCAVSRYIRSVQCHC